MSIAARTESSESDRWIGRVLAERYRVEAHLADGGMARVYAAIHVTLSMPVAVKILEARHGVDPRLVGRFQREAMATARLRHPHIVQVLDTGTLPEGELYLVMELLGGADLASILARGRLGARRTMRVLRQLALAIDHAHAQGIVHRDLKPENVMVNEAANDFVKVLDFGVARDLKQDTSYTTYGEVVGTAEYMAPEQALGLADSIGPAADRWALAAMALEMLTGDLPYPSAPLTTTLGMIVDAPPRRPGDLGLCLAGLDEVYDRAMARRAEARYPSAEAFVRALELALEPVLTDDRDPERHSKSGDVRVDPSCAGRAMSVFAKGECAELAMSISGSHSAASHGVVFPFRFGPAVVLAALTILSSAFAMGWMAALAIAR